MKTVVFSNQKGGCGKTSTAHSFAAGLAAKGCRVLLVDADPQCNISDWCGIEENDGGKTLRHIMLRTAKAAECVRHTENEGLDIIPGDILLSGADTELMRDLDAPYYIREALEELAGSYDYAVIDTPPALGVMTGAALIAADDLIIPLTPDRFSFKGIEQLIANVKRFQRRANTGLNVAGVLLTRCDRTSVTNVMLDQIKEYAEALGTKVYQTRIRQAVAIREAQFMGTDIYADGSKAAEDYRKFIEEYLEG